MQLYSINYFYLELDLNEVNYVSIGGRLKTTAAYRPSCYSVCEKKIRDNEPTYKLVCISFKQQRYFYCIFLFSDLNDDERRLMDLVGWCEVGRKHMAPK